MNYFINAVILGLLHSRAVKLAMYFWYLSRYGANVTFPIWERKSGTRLIRMFNNKAAAHQDVSNVHDYGKATYKESVHCRRLFVVNYSDPVQQYKPIGGHQASQGETRFRILQEKPDAPEDIEEYERLLSERFADDPDLPQSPAVVQAVAKREKRLEQLYKKLFGS